MPNYKLTYFNFQALGEPIRLLFIYGKKDFEDNRLNRDEWPHHKPNYPIGKLPILEIDGKVYNQSLSLCRYVAREIGLSGKNALEDLTIDGIIDTILDLRIAATAYYLENVPQAKENKKVQLYNEILPTILKYLEEKVEENEGFFALKRLTWADFVFAGYAYLLTKLCNKDIFKEKPILKALVEKVNNLPGIKEKKPCFNLFLID